MFQVVSSKRALRTLAGIALIAVLSTPHALAAENPEPARELQLAQGWLADQQQGLEQTLPGQESGESECHDCSEKPASPSGQTSSEPESESEPSDVDVLLAWLDAQEAEVKATAEATLGELGHEADKTLAEGQAMIDAMAIQFAPTEEETETQSAYTPEAPSRTRAIVAATVAVAATAGSIFVMFWTAGSTVGTAGTAAASKSSATGLRKVAPAFSPLFTRFEGRDVLKHPNRAQLYTLVAANPGVRLQDLCEETMLSRTAVTHHLRLLEQQHLLVSERVGRSRHYYENGGRYEREKKEAYAVLQNDRSKDIAQFILSNPGTIQKNLCESLDVRASIAHWHVKRLEEASLVEAVRKGRTVSYYPAGSLSSLAF